MKPNIDLTENQIFSRINFDSIVNTISIKYFRIPWNIGSDYSGDEYDLSHQKKSLIALGDRKQREEVKLYRKMDSGNYCECCGKRINLTPWNKEIGLCKKCDKSMEYDFNDKCPWRAKDNIIIS